MSRILKENKKFIILFSVVFALVFSVGFMTPTKAAGALLYLSSSSGSYEVGNTFSVAVRVNTGGVAVNAANGTLSFNNKLEVVSLSKNDSVFSFWIKNPTYSNSSRTISFSGGIPSPGFIGSETILTITFKAKSAGSGAVNFTSGSVLANDGAGTNILTSRGSGIYTISVASPPPQSGPQALKISSLTHPDENKWYSQNDPKFSWKLSSDISAVSFSLDGKSSTYLDYTSEGEESSKDYKNVKDGAWYFHLRVRNNNGWSNISSYKIQIDTARPDPFEIIVDGKGDNTNPQPIILFKANDSLSGIDYYEIKIGKSESVKTKKDSYKIPLQLSGKHTISVKAVDKAGNYTIEISELEIKSIEVPKIIDCPKILYLGDPFYLRGEALPEVTVYIYIQKEGEEDIFQTKVRSDKEGKFSYDHDRLLERGKYKVWVEAEDLRGAKSSLSEKVSVSVGPCAFIKIGSFTVNYFVALLVLTILSLILCILIWWICRKIKERRKKIGKEITDTENALYRAFFALKEEIGQQLETFDARPRLSPKERKIFDELKTALNTSEKFIKEELKDIKDELEKNLLKNPFKKKNKKNKKLKSKKENK